MAPKQLPLGIMRRHDIVERCQAMLALLKSSLHKVPKQYRDNRKSTNPLPPAYR